MLSVLRMHLTINPAVDLGWPIYSVNKSTLIDTLDKECGYLN